MGEEQKLDEEQLPLEEDEELSPGEDEKAPDEAPAEEQDKPEDEDFDKAGYTKATQKYAAHQKVLEEQLVAERGQLAAERAENARLRQDAHPIEEEETLPEGITADTIAAFDAMARRSAFAKDLQQQVKQLEAAAGGTALSTVLSELRADPVARDLLPHVEADLRARTAQYNVRDPEAIRMVFKNLAYERLARSQSATATHADESRKADKARKARAGRSPSSARSGGRRTATTDLSQMTKADMEKMSDDELDQHTAALLQHRLGPNLAG